MQRTRLARPALFVVSSLWLSLFATPAAALCGDCDQDGDVDVLDTLVLAQHTLGLTTLTPAGLWECSADPYAPPTVLDVLRVAQDSVGITPFACQPVPLPIATVSPFTCWEIDRQTILYLGMASTAPMHPPVDALLEVSTDGGVTWRPATPYAGSNPMLGITRTDLLFHWCAPADGVAAVSSATLRLTVTDPYGSSTSIAEVDTGPPARPRVLGPGGGEIASVAFDPADPLSVAVGTLSGAVARSVDGGTSFAVEAAGVHPLHQVDSVTFDAAQPGRLLAVADLTHIVSQTVPGTPWTSVPEYAIAASDSFFQHPADPMRFFGTQKSFVVSTLDGGATWSYGIGTGWPLGVMARARVLAGSPTDPDVIYAASSDQILRSGDSGANWLRIVGTLPPGVIVKTLVASPRDPGVLWVGLEDEGVWKTIDDGVTWTPVHGGSLAPPITITHLAVAPTDPDVLIAASGAPSDPALFDTSNGGATWSRFGLPFLPSATEDRGVRGIAIDPANPDIAIAGGRFGLLRRTNGGSGWTPIGADIDSYTGTRLAIDPTNSSHLLSISERYGSGAVHRTSDGGVTWSEGLLDSHDITFDDGGSVAFALAPDDLLRSTDGGVTWTPSGLASVMPLVALQVTGSGPASIVVAAADATVQRSDDGGVTFTDITPGGLPMPADVVDWGLARSPLDPDRFTLSGYHLGLFTTVDGGASWTMTLPPSPPGVQLQRTSVGYSSLDPDYAVAVKWRELLESTDGGLTWSTVTASLPLPSTRGVVIDPTDDDHVIAHGCGLHQSRDGGQTWEHLDQGLGRYVWHAVFDPANPARLLVVTAEGVVEVFP